MTGNLKLRCNFVEKYMGTVRFGNDHFTLILGYGDLVQGNIMINRVYYVEGLNHSLFSVGQFCDADLEVAFRKSTCFVRDLQGNDLLTGNHRSDLYTISLQETTSSTPICFMAKASPTQAWLWHRRLSHLNFDYINLLSKKDIVIGLPKLKYVKYQLCSTCEVSKAKKKFIQDKGCSKYTWTLFLRSKDETPEVLKDFLKMIQLNLQAQVINVRTDKGTKFLNKTLHAYFKEEGISYQTSTPLVETARTMILSSKLLLFFWAEAIATACYTQNKSIIILTHEKTAYHIINDKKPSIRHLHIFGTSSVNKSSSPTDNPAQQDTQPSMNIHPTTEPITPTTTVTTEENNTDNQAKIQVDNEHVDDNEFYNVFSTPVCEEAESSSRYVDPSNMHTFYQPHQSEHRWIKDHLLSQVHGNPSKPVQTRRKLAADPEMCMFVLTMSIAEPKNIKDAITDSAWIEAMQDELH
ncbi:retrovirus-related pol polyprotein from transposon TNT 1-94 [Tanacetum coccineum]